MRWLVATVAETVPETARAVTLRLDVPDWRGHRPGQHVDVRLTAEDGYSAQRSYSIASPPGADRLELTVERIDDGEVSPYLTSVADVGDLFELRGPIGGWFVWDGHPTAPVLLVGGGSGVVPLMAMLRHHAASRSTTAMHLVYSARTLSDVIYREELAALASPHRAVTLTLTRESSSDWVGHRGRVDAELLAELGWPPTVQPHATCVGPPPSSRRWPTPLSGSVMNRHGSGPNDSDQPEADMDTTPLDGNATAGALGELFAFDVTMAVTTCAHCRDTRPVAELRAYVRAPGTVLRCRSCGGVQLRLVQSTERAWLDLRGIQVLHIPASAKV